MKNAKQELLHILKDTRLVKCAIIYKLNIDDKNNESKVLKLNYTEDDYNEFLNKLDFEYNEDYGTQILYGIVWLEDNTWLLRGEYDGSEWWKHITIPEIPVECYI